MLEGQIVKDKTLKKGIPWLRLTIVGMARPDAPPELGLALSQARAVSVRSHLLGLLSASAAWQGEDPSDGLRSWDVFWRFFHGFRWISVVRLGSEARA